MAKGGSQAAVAESKKARRETRAFNQRSLKMAQEQFKATANAQREQMAQMAALSRTSAPASESSRDRALAADDYARAIVARQSFSKFRFSTPLAA